MRGRRARTVGQFAADLIEGFDQAPAVVPRGYEPAGWPGALGEVGPPEIRHAKEAQAACRVVADRVYRHDMSMLEPRENLGLVAIGPRYLDGHQPPPQVDLLGEIDPCESPSSQLQDDAKARQFVSRLKQAVTRTRHALDSGARAARMPSRSGRPGRLMINRREDVGGTVSSAAEASSAKPARNSMTCSALASPACGLAPKPGLLETREPSRSTRTTCSS